MKLNQLNEDHCKFHSKSDFKVFKKMHKTYKDKVKSVTES